jgi:hypothetical protein
LIYNQNGMQTYFCEAEPDATARRLDRQRLGKQRNEALQIARILAGVTDRAGWSTHPIVRMWRPYLPYLVHVYVPAMLQEWEARGYRGPRTRATHAALAALVTGRPVRPAWVTPDLIRSHRSYLKRRNPEYYGRFWPDVPADLPLRWPDS